MNTEAIKELKRLAEAARGWPMDQVQQTPDDLEAGVACVGCADEDGSFSEVMSIDTGLYFAEEQAINLANFYAAANQAAIKWLIAQLEAAQAELAAIRALEPAGWFKPSLVDWRGNPVRWDQLVHGHGTPLYALPEQK